MDEVVEWLRSMGLELYAPQFAENYVDATLLSELTDQFLKEIGVNAVGHRMKMLRAVAARAADGAPHSTVPVAVPARVQPADANPVSVTDRTSTATAERRHLTVMFCDLVGSTALAARLDPEDMREVVRAYQGAAAQAIGQYEGFVAQYLGDGIMAYFGYPIAHEDDAERAVRAGLDLVAAVSRLDSKAKVEVRVGIATGLVVVGDLIGEHAARERAVTGETPNLAARLQALAAPGTILLSAATRRLLGSQFDLRELASQQVKGLDAPVTAFAVIAARSFESRFEARAGGLTGFVGREEECEQLLDRWRSARQERGQVVLVSGEAGIGKSRLTAWLVDKVAAEPHIRMRYQCTPHHKNSALYPTISQIERAAGIELNEAAEEKLAKLEALLALANADGGEAVPLFASLLAIPTVGRYPPLVMSPGEQRQRTMAAMLDQVEGLAKRNPLLMAYEDAHWADATSLELLAALVDRVPRLPILLIITGRPEFDPAWAGRHSVSTLGLDKLDRRQTRTMIENVTGGAALPADLLDQIVAKTDGIPLFVEELTKTVLESGVLVDEGDILKVNGALPIPATLQDSLMARLDRSNPVKEIAQIGAAIGREFSYELLTAVAGMDVATIRTGLAKLEETELASRRGVPPDATYTFKHALVQDAAYESLLKSRRRTVHRRIAKTLRDQFRELAQAQPETIAHHFERAERPWQAVEWWTKAGLLGNQRGAYVEALSHFGRAVRLADTIELDQAQLRPRLQLQIEYRSALISVYGWGVPETSAAFAKSTEIGSRLGGLEERMAYEFGAWLPPYIRGEAIQSLALAETYRRIVNDLSIELERFTADNIVAQSLWPCGRFADAVAHFESSMAIYEKQKYLPWFSADGVTINLSMCALPLWALGRTDEALVMCERAAAHARTTGSFASIALSMAFACKLAIMRANLKDLERLTRELCQLSAKHDLKYWLLVSDMLLNLSGCSGHDAATAIAKSRDQIAIHQSLGSFVLDPLHYALLSDLVSQENKTASLQFIDEILNHNAQKGLKYFDAELLRRRGHLLTALGQRDNATAALQSAVAVAREQGARSFEVRASLDLARLYCDTGREGEALPVLRGALVGLAATPELPEVGEAQRLLAGLL